MPPKISAVKASTLLIVGGVDHQVIVLNQEALQILTCSPKELIVIPGATHLFEEPGTLEPVVRHALEWFRRFLIPLDRVC
jgi:putative phosphoribosyl transferase